MSGLLLSCMRTPLGRPPGGPSRQKVTLHATALSDCPYSAPAPLRYMQFLLLSLTEDMKLHVSSSQCNALLRPLAAGSRNRNIIYTRAREAPVESAINAM